LHALQCAQAFDGGGKLDAPWFKRLRDGAGKAKGIIVSGQAGVQGLAMVENGLVGTFDQFQFAVFLFGPGEFFKLKADSAGVGNHSLDGAFDVSNSGGLGKHALPCGIKLFLHILAPFDGDFGIGKIIIGLQIAVDAVQHRECLLFESVKVRCQYFAGGLNMQGR